MSDILKHIAKNWKAGLTTSLISIPLSIALAITSGATPIQGIITAVWAGLIGAIFGSSNFNIIGPTGAIAGILISYTQKQGENGFATLPYIAILSGLIIFVIFILKFDKYIIFIPKSVIHGFTLGVAFIIGLGQFDYAFGLQGIKKSTNLHLYENVFFSIKHLREMNWIIFGIFLITTIFILLWNKKFPKVPGPIIVSFLSIIIVFLCKIFHYPITILTLGEKYPSLKVSLFENSFSGINDWNFLLGKEIWFISIAVSIIAVLETLLSGQIANEMTKTKFNRSKEVFGLSLANIVSGLMGGIPATAALARTALNIKSGANHKTSGIINGIFIGIIALFLLSYFKMLPMVIIASILTVVSIGMVDKKHFSHLYKYEKTSFWLAIFVALVVFFEDPIVGILVGTAIALLIFVKKMSYGQTEVLVWKDGKMTDILLKSDFVKRDSLNSDIVVYKISGNLTYINMPAHLEAMEKIKGNKYVIVSFRHAFYADIDGIDYLREIINTLKNNNENVYLAGINQEIKGLIKNESFYKTKLAEGRVYTRTSEAIKQILSENTDK